jgi:hypothetical protein
VRVDHGGFLLGWETRAQNNNNRSNPMKTFNIALGALALLASVSAFADFTPSYPDFDMIKNYEKSVIAKDAQVISYAKKLGATSFKVTNGKPANLLYAVETNNGCAFDVEVVYNDWPGIDGIVVYKNAVCR